MGVCVGGCVGGCVGVWVGVWVGVGGWVCARACVLYVHVVMCSALYLTGLGLSCQQEVLSVHEYLM